MLNFTRVTEKIGSIIDNKCSNPTKLTGVLTAPFSKMRSVLYSVKAKIQSRQGSYDAIGASFTNVDEFFDVPEDTQVRLKQVLSDSDHLVREGEGLPFIEISYEQFDMLINSLIQVFSDMDKSSEEESNFLNITDSRGFSYYIPKECFIRDLEWRIYTVNDQGHQTDLLWSDDSHYYCSLVMCPSTTVYERVAQPVEATLQSKSIIRSLLRGYSPGGTLFRMNSQGQETDSSTTLHDLCDPENTGDTLSGGLSEICEDLDVSTSYNDTYQGPLVATAAVFSDIAASGTINRTISLMCDAALSLSPDASLQALASDLDSGSTIDQSAKRLVNKARLAYAESRLAGLVTYIAKIFKNASSLRTDDSGYIFVQTNDEDLLPKEYIAGLVNTIVTGVVQVLSMILMIVGNVWTMIIGGLLAIGTAIYQSFQSDIHDTNVTIEKAEQVDSLNLMGVGPEALLQGTFPNKASYQNLWNAFNMFRSAICIDVIGGSIFVGPLGYGTDGDGKVQSYDAWNVSAWAWEFHPAARLAIKTKVDPRHRTDLFCQNLFSHHAFFDENNNSVDMVVSPCYYYAPHNIQKIWGEYLNELSTAEWPTDDLADDSIDYRIRINSVLCCWFFLGAYIYNQLPDDYDYRRDHEWFCFNYNTVTPGDYGIMDLFYFANRIWESGFTANDVTAPSWTSILTALIQIQSTRKPGAVISDTIPMVIENSTSMTDVYDYVVEYNEFYERQFISSIYEVVQDGETTIGCSSVYGLPMDLHFAYKIPKFDKATFWRNIAIAGAVTAVVAVSAIAVSVKYMKFAKQKRTRNRALFENAQSTYNNAVVGRETYIGEDGIERVREFDVNSEEGKQKINDAYKAYKKTAFKNNLWSHLVGGSRYDINTFYGEAEAAETDGSGFSSYTDIYSPVSDDGTFDYPEDAGSSASTTLIYAAITGKSYG